MCVFCILVRKWLCTWATVWRGLRETAVRQKRVCYPLQRCLCTLSQCCECHSSDTYTHTNTQICVQNDCSCKENRELYVLCGLILVNTLFKEKHTFATQIHCGRTSMFYSRIVFLSMASRWSHVFMYNFFWPSVPNTRSREPISLHCLNYLQITSRFSRDYHNRHPKANPWTLLC